MNGPGSGALTVPANFPSLPRLIADGCDLLLVREGRVQRLRGHRLRISALLVTPDGDLAITGSQDTTVRLWHLATGEERACLRGHTGEIMHLVLAPDGRTLATAGRDGTARLWDLETGEERLFLPHPVPPFRVLFAGDRVVTGAPVDGVRVWSRAGEQLAFHATWELPEAITPDGTAIVLTSGSQVPLPLRS